MATTTTYNLKQKIEAINTSKNEIKSAIEDKIEASIGESYEILGNIQTYANEIGKIVTPNNQTLPTITENGTYEYNVDTYTGLNNVTVNVNQSVQDITIFENGTYNASEGYIGFGEVTVDVEKPPLMTKTITQNGTYKAEDDNIYGYDEVVVDVTGEFLVQVIDYDGTVLKSEMLNEGQVFTLPEETPTHSGLIFQEWSSPVDIVNNGVTVGQSDIIIGATYTTASGLSEFDITLTKVTGLTVTLNMNGTKNWGDGTSDTATSHTYSDYGDYTISCNGTNITDNGLFLPKEIVTFARLTGITTIQSRTFDDESCLKNIILSKNVAVVNSNAFANCYSLKTIVFPNNTSYIDDYTLTNCYSLKYIVLGNTLTNIGASLCYGCYSLEYITLPNSVTNINTTAFYNCYSLKSMTIPSEVTSIGENAFYSCKSLEWVKILGDLDFLHARAFYDCTSLYKLEFLGQANEIPTGLCQQCYSLKTVVLPNNITNIKGSAFNSCFCLTDIEIPTTVTSIGGSCFNNCHSLQSLKIPSSVSTISGNTFYLCWSVIEYDFSEHTSVPTLSNTSAFNGINAICKIKVPASLESEWKTATNWSTYANYIVGV